MKKIRIIVGAILRCVLLIAPGALFGWWAWPQATASIAVLAAVGVETVFLFVFSFVSVAIQSWRKLRNSEAADANAVDEWEIV